MYHMPSTKSSPRNHSLGFTLVELMVVVVLIPVIIASFIFVIYSSVDEATIAKNRLDVASKNQIAMDVLERDIRYGTEFNTSVPSIPEFDDTYASSYNNGGSPPLAYNGSGANSRVLIISQTATQLSGSRNTTRTPVFIDSPTYNCTAAEIAYNPQLQYLVVYFVKSNTLYRRTLTYQAPVTLCNSATPIQKQSCPPDQQAGWTTICKARDEIIATSVDQFSIDYFKEYNTPGSDIAIPYSPSNADALKSAEANDLNVTLSITQSFAGKPITSSSTVRISKINKVIAP